MKKYICPKCKAVLFDSTSPVYYHDESIKCPQCDQSYRQDDLIELDTDTGSVVSKGTEKPQTDNIPGSSLADNKMSVEETI